MKKIKTLPAMACEKCGECCGLVPVTETEWQRVARYAKNHGVTPVDQGVTCPWFQGGACAVYPVRPLPCRLFGHAIGMPCPHGHNVNLSDRDVHRMMRANGKPTRLLHDIIPDFAQRLMFDSFMARIKEAAGLFLRDLSFILTIAPPRSLHDAKEDKTC